MATPLRGGLPKRDPDQEAAGDAYGADDGSELVTGESPKPKEAGSATRGADGKFTKGGDKGAEKKEKPVAAAEGKTAAAKPKHGPPQLMPDGTIRMAGKVFNNLAHLQQVFLSKAGDASQVSSRVAQLQQENQGLKQRVVDAVSVATQWQKYAETQSQGGQGQQGQQGQQAAPTTPAQAQDTKPQERHFTLAAYNAMKEKFGDAAANEYAQRAMAKDRENDEKRYQETVDARIQERLGPLEQQTRTQSEIQAARNFLLQAMPQYQELQDPTAREQIVTKWMSFPEALRYSQDLSGIRHAVLDYRDTQSQSAQRAESDDLDPLDGLDLPSYTLDDDSGSGTPRPGEGAGGNRDLESQLVHGASGPQDEDSSFLPSL